MMVMITRRWLRQHDDDDTNDNDDTTTMEMITMILTLWRCRRDKWCSWWYVRHKSDEDQIKAEHDDNADAEDNDEANDD